MKCPKCGTEMDDRANFCPVCGESMQGPEPQYQPPQYQPPMNGGYRAPIGQRSIPVCIILTIVTCGIYGLYWLYCLAEDLNTVSRDGDGASGGMVVLLSIVTCSIYELYWMYKAGGMINEARCRAGEREDGSLGILYLLLSLFGFSIVAYALIQNELNKVAGLD